MSKSNQIKIKQSGNLKSMKGKQLNIKGNNERNEMRRNRDLQRINKQEI